MSAENKPKIVRFQGYFDETAGIDVSGKITIKYGKLNLDFPEDYTNQEIIDDFRAIMILEKSEDKPNQDYINLLEDTYEKIIDVLI